MKTDILQRKVKDFTIFLKGPNPIEKIFTEVLCYSNKKQIPPPSKAQYLKDINMVNSLLQNSLTLNQFIQTLSREESIHFEDNDKAKLLPEYSSSDTKIASNFSDLYKLFGIRETNRDLNTVLQFINIWDAFKSRDHSITFRDLSQITSKFGLSERSKASHIFAIALNMFNWNQNQIISTLKDLEAERTREFFERLWIAQK